MRIMNGCYFEPDEDEPVDPVVGRKKGSVGFSASYYHRRSALDSVPDDFEERMRKHDVKGLIAKEKKPVIPKNDLK
jgi:hypothetical protein